MSPQEIRAALQRLGLSQLAFSKLIGISDRAMRQYVSAGTAQARWIPEPYARLLLLMEDVPGVVDRLRDYAEQYEDVAG